MPKDQERTRGLMWQGLGVTLGAVLRPQLPKLGGLVGAQLPLGSPGLPSDPPSLAGAQSLGSTPTSPVFRDLLALPDYDGKLMSGCYIDLLIWI